MKLKLKELDGQDVVRFVPLTEEYGRAEFVFCPIWRAGRLARVFIYPKQQPHAEFYYKINLDVDAMQVMTWRHQGFEEPKIWIFDWCREHKCMSFAVYPPDGTNSFKVMVGSELTIVFEKSEVK